MTPRGYLGTVVLLAALAAGLVIGAVVHVIERVLAEEGGPWHG